MLIHNKKNHACFLCDFRSRTVFSLERHVREHKKDCKTILKTLKTVKVNNIVNHPHNLKNQVNTYKCVLCNWCTTSAFLLERHIRYHKNLLPIPGHPTRLFNREFIETVYKNKLHKCRICDISTRTSYLLDRHMRSHKKHHSHHIKHHTILDVFHAFTNVTTVGLYFSL